MHLSCYSDITLKLSIPRSSMIFTVTLALSPFSKGSGTVPLNALIFSSSISGFQVSCQSAPAVFRSGHGEEYLGRKQTAVVIVCVQKPHGDISLAAGIHIPGFGVVIIKSKHFHLIFSFILSLSVAFSRTDDISLS